MTAQSPMRKSTQQSTPNDRTSDKLKWKAYSAGKNMVIQRH